MSRKKRNRDAYAGKAPARAPEAEHSSGVRRPLLVCAAALAVAGYFFLRRTGPAGGDVYAVLAPIFLLAGYLLVPAAILSSRRPPSEGEK